MLMHNAYVEHTQDVCPHLTKHACHTQTRPKRTSSPGGRLVQRMFSEHISMFSFSSPGPYCMLQYRAGLNIASPLLQAQLGSRIFITLKESAVSFKFGCHGDPSYPILLHTIWSCSGKGWTFSPQTPRLHKVHGKKHLTGVATVAPPKQLAKQNCDQNNSICPVLQLVSFKYTNMLRITWSIVKSDSQANTCTGLSGTLNSIFWHLLGNGTTPTDLEPPPAAARRHIFASSGWLLPWLAWEAIPSLTSVPIANTHPSLLYQS